ncbi:sugar phosphate isomerase/epimerase [Streptomyces malaysiensis subsp. malaysiensis]|uniref:Sugar phosphate isomerase/epimerase n=1 Tax=Streptomyces malaysiensis TaxID=92644 RepID=A0ABX6WJ45_STRMQ|nr:MULTISPECIES: sugar phosphate isomerase/epimerase family protein [Streptomyces]QPI61396.1 sugar phosphate isomerase/epimerase [Streptomyces solisilvae]UHH23178.1 sugar phosphate isomerase/epimerase [Streptomyces sp. HNM0561]
MNRRAFSTLGCPGSGLDEVVRLARTGPCDGVELRCAAGQPTYPGMPETEADAVAAHLTAAGLDIVCLASYVQVAADRADVVEDLAGHLRLAARLGAPSVRVFGGGADQPEGRRDRAVRCLSRAAPLAARLGVDVLLETHDEFLTGERVADVIEAVGSPAVGSVWDAVNPWRAGESPDRTAALLGPWIRHVQLKDVATPTDLRPVLPGHGNVPLAAVVEQLHRLGYQGWISLEWERAWYPEAAGLDQALTAFHQVLDTLAPPPTGPAPSGRPAHL